LGCPQLVRGNNVEVAVVLAEVAGGITKVPKEVGADVVPAESPDVARGIGREQALRTAADLVRVADLPCGVVEEAQRRRLHEEVVVIRRAAQKRGVGSDLVAHSEAEPVDVEAAAHGEIGRSVDDVPELARTRRGAVEAGGAAATRVTAGAVV